MWDKSSLAERVVVIWGLLIASSAVIYVAVSLSNIIFENSSNIASWVQAIGAILAIFAAGHHITRQMNHAEFQSREARKAEDRITMNACVHAACDAALALENLAGKIAGDDPMLPKTSFERISGLDSTFRILLAKQIPSEAVVPILKILREVSYSLSAIRAGRAESGSERIIKAYKRSNTVREAAEELISAARRMSR